MPTTERREGGPDRRIRLAPLRVPLAAKLVGANLLVVAILVGAWRMAGGPFNGPVAVILLSVIAVHLALVLVALLPIRDLETVATRVWNGDVGARVERSRLADDEVLRIGSMFNILLDGLESDRSRLRALTGEVIAAGDRERAVLARELHDSTAQEVAGLLLQLSSAARDATDPNLAQRLRAARDSAEAILEEVRVLSHTMHPAVLDDLGLGPALRKLARDVSHGNGVDVDVDVRTASSDRIPRNVEAVLYRVAQEAVRNATKHASARRIRITLHVQQSVAMLEIYDDGRGFDLAEAERRASGIGLLSMRERLALVNGQLDIKTAPGNGTTLSIVVPLVAEPSAVD